MREKTSTHDGVCESHRLLRKGLDEALEASLRVVLDPRREGASRDAAQVRWFIEVVAIGHMRDEENRLFPALGGEHRERVEALRAEHDALLGVLGALRRQSFGEPGVPIRERGSYAALRFLRMFEVHNAREEVWLAPREPT